eukprot:Phypoly_transcript_11034.p2 GENE.Phypoly_transcript_11034~~Phypoly_transcript_11034.p2  ORF type:complete len:128 (-),score=15.03 Phypoly_transcript_11034:816-1199(-)
MSQSLAQQWDLEDFPIKEYHFHVYFFQSNPTSVAKAEALRNKILSLTSANPNAPTQPPPSNPLFVAVPLHTVNYTPVGPHLIGSYEVWVPIESFAVVFGWFTLNRDDLSILVHPLTRYIIIRSFFQT